MKIEKVILAALMLYTAIETPLQAMEDIVSERKSVAVLYQGPGMRALPTDVEGSISLTLRGEKTSKGYRMDLYLLNKGLLIRLPDCEYDSSHTVMQGPSFIISESEDGGNFGCNGWVRSFGGNRISYSDYRGQKAPYHTSVSIPLNEEGCALKALLFTLKLSYKEVDGLDNIFSYAHSSSVKALYEGDPQLSELLTFGKPLALNK